VEEPKKHLLGGDSSTWAPVVEEPKKHLLGEDPATYAPEPAAKPLLGGDSATWAPEPEERRRLVGGATPLTAEELESEDVVKAAQFGLSEHLKRTQYLMPVTFVKVVSGTKQVVRGVKYSLTFALSDKSTHTVVLVDAAWLTPRYEILELDGVDMLASSATTASSPGRRLAMAGASSGIAIDSPEVKEAAMFAFQQLSMQMNSLTPPTFSKVLKASKQVVAGMKYDLEIELSDASKHHVVVVDTPWLTPRFSLVTHEVLF
jgi:hypothetical protein